MQISVDILLMHRWCSPKNHIFGHFVSIYFRSFFAERAKLNLNVRKLFVLDVDIVFTCSTSNKFFYQTFAQCGPNLVCSEKSRLSIISDPSLFILQIASFFPTFWCK